MRISRALADLNDGVDLNAALGDAVKARQEKKKEMIAQKQKDKLKNKLEGLFR